MTMLDSTPQRNAYAANRLPGYLTGVLLLASLVISWGAFTFFRPAGGEYEVNLALVLLWAVVIFGVIQYVASRVVEGPRQALNRTVTLLVSAALVVAMIPLTSLVYTVLTLGVARFDLDFFSLTMRNVVGEGGGASHAVVGTVIMTLLATVISVPVGLLTSIYLVEYGEGKRLSRSIQVFVDVMTGIPSIVAGLFAYSLFALIVGPGTRFGLGGAIALSVIMIPIVVRSSEEMLRLVPNELREAAFALGVPKWLTILKVVIPTALAGISAGVTLAIARVLGETAPLLIAAGFTANFNFNPFSERMMSLPNFVYYSYVAQGTIPEAYLDRAWAGALTLILIVMALNLVARLIARIFAPKYGR